MKKLLNIILMMSAVVVLSCKDDTTDHVSFITTYPVIALNGPQLVILEKGTAFEETANATIGDETVPLTITGSVDSSTPGIYTIVYAASNKDNFARVTQRQVVIYDPATDAVDLTGDYARTTNGVTVHVEKVAPSVYHIDDAGGLGESFLDVLFINTEDDVLIIPIQVAPSSGITVASVPGTGKINADGFQWVLSASAVYGGATRVFTKL